MSKPLVSIITANSNSGSSCMKELFDRYADKVQVRGLFRTEEKAKDFRAKYPKLEVVTGVDASQPETLKKAFENAQYALIVTPHDQTKGIANDAALTETMINHAVANNVKYIVLVASWTVKDVAKMPLISGRFESSVKLLEKLGKEKGIKWTVLLGGYFMENYLYAFKNSIKAESAIHYPNVYVPMVDTRDIGKSAAACLASANIDQHHGKFYEMNGPELLSSQQVADTFTKVLGKPIKWTEMSIEDVKAHMPEAIAQVFVYMIENGKEVPFTDDVKKLTGQNGTFEQFLIDHKNHFD